jgi:hypothetical protein
VICEFEVYCKNGCGWTGPLREHDSHLKIHPPDDKLQAAKMVAGGAALGTATGVSVAGAAAATTAEFVVGGLFFGTAYIKHYHLIDFFQCGIELHPTHIYPLILQFLMTQS